MCLECQRKAAFQARAPGPGRGRSKENIIVIPDSDDEDIGQKVRKSPRNKGKGKAVQREEPIVARNVLGNMQQGPAPPKAVKAPVPAPAPEIPVPQAQLARPENAVVEPNEELVAGYVTTVLQVVPDASLAHVYRLVKL